MCFEEAHQHLCVRVCALAPVITCICHCVYMCWCSPLRYIIWVLHVVCIYVCESVGVAQEPQFLYGPICFVLFVLLINEIRGAACWDGPTAPPHWTAPLSHGLTLFSKRMPSFFRVLSLFLYLNSLLSLCCLPSHLLI